MEHFGAYEGKHPDRSPSFGFSVVTWKRQIPANNGTDDTVTFELKFKVSDNALVVVWQPLDPDIPQEVFHVDEDDEEVPFDPCFAIIRYAKNDGSFTYRPGGRDETTSVKPLQFRPDLKAVDDIVCEQSSFSLPTPMGSILKTGPEYDQKGSFSTALEVFLAIAELIPQHESQYLLDEDFESGGRIWHHQNGYWLAFTCDGATPKFAREKSEAQERECLHNKKEVFFETSHFKGSTFTQAKLVFHMTIIVQEEYVLQQKIRAAEAQANEAAEKIALQNYDLLMNCRPGVEFNCSQLMHPERVRAVLKNVAKEHPDAVAQVTTLTLCSNALVDSDQLLNLLQDFSSLKHLNISSNSTLRFLTREVSFQLDHPDVDVQYAVKGIQRFLNESNINLSNTKMDAADALKIASELQHLFSNLQSESSQSQSPITINISKNPELKGSRLEGLGSGCLLILSKLEGPQLYRIQELNLSETGLKDFDTTKDSNLLLMLLLKELLRLPNLKKLDISKNSVRALPAGFIKFAATRLKEFDCSGCSLIFPPQLLFGAPFCMNSGDVLTKLRQLVSSEHSAFRSHLASEELCRVLNLSGLELPLEMCKELAPILPNLDRLREINLQNCRRLSAEGLEVLIHHAPGKFVCRIILSGSDIEYIPYSLSKFTSLTEVRMDNCKKLTLLPSLFARLPLISVAQCPNLSYPPKSICKTNDMRKIQGFLQKAELWKRLKVVFLGNGRCGKSSLLRCLAKLPLDPEEISTRGVKVDVQMNADEGGLKPNFFDKVAYGNDLDPTFWDFAGQLEYSASHHTFLSSRQAVYVIVFSVIENYESVQQQLSYWLSLIPNIFTRYVRVIIAGTQIDRLKAEDYSIRLDEFKTVVELVLQARGGYLVPDELSDKQFDPPHEFNFSAILRFTTANHNFRGFSKSGRFLQDDEFSWAKCRSKFKKSLYTQMGCIFHKDDDTLKYPADVRLMKRAVEHNLKKKLRGALPCCPLADPRACDALGALFENPESNKKNYYQSEVVMDMLNVLHDLGIVVLYNQRKSICVEPQYLPGIMALFVDPATELSAVISGSKLKQFLKKHVDVTRAKSDAEIDELLRLLKSVGILCVPGRPAANRRELRMTAVAADSAGDLTRATLAPNAEREYLIPLALRGRPVTWSQVHVSRDISKAFMMGRRLGNSGNHISSSTFLEIMLKKCNIVERMWGCAFAYDLQVPGPNSSSIFVFVRLKEDRSCVDVVILMPDDSYASKKSANHELDNLFSLLRKSLGDEDDRLFLCPVCCSSNSFVRWGVTHTFYEEELIRGSSLRCGRCHDVTVSNVKDGKLIMLDIEALPLVYPRNLQQLQLPWKHIGPGGIVFSCADAAEADPGRAQSNRSSSDSPLKPQISEGLVSETGFFVLTGQLKAGDCIAPECLPLLEQQLQLCASQDVNCEISLVDGTRKCLMLSYRVGDTFSNSYTEGRPMPIRFIFPGDVGERIHDPSMQLPRFCANDCVIVLFGEVEKKTSYISFPGSSSNLQMCRLTPELCQADITAARCWSELQDQVSVVLGTEYEMYQITALTIFRNEARAEAFMSYRDDLRKRQLDREARNERENEHWMMTPSDVANHLGTELASFKHLIERRSMNSEKLVGLSDSDVGVLEREVAAGPRGQHRSQQLDSFKDKLQKVKEMAEARKATMWRFENTYATKFGVGNPQENVNVNLSVAWWGNARGNQVYQAVAQNGFSNLPSVLRLDQGFYGNGFYFTRYPRYSDYYISGCKLNSKDIGASFLMNYVLCGRPFPVTKFPDNSLPLMGQPCNERSPCKGGPDRHDSHYVCVKAPHYIPCGAREEPDFDEIVLFNPVAVLPMVAVEFTRRLKTVLWLDSRPERNYHILKKFPGCPATVGLLTTAAYPMKEHCSVCKHPLSIDANPCGTFWDLKRAVETAHRGIDKLQDAVKLGLLSDSAANELKKSYEAEIFQAEAAIPAAEAANDATLGLHDEIAGKNLSQEQQVHIMLFLRAQDLARFLMLHPELSQYPSSLLRIITTQEQFLEIDGLQQFFDRDSTWRFKFPTTYVTDVQEDRIVMPRPNMWLAKSTRDQSARIFEQQLWRFGTFQSLALLGKK